MVYNAELAKTISYFSAHTFQKFHTNSSVTVQVWLLACLDIN